MSLVCNYVQDDSGRFYKTMVPDTVWDVDPSTVKSIGVLAPAKACPENIKVSTVHKKSPPVPTSRYLAHRAAPGTPEVYMKAGIRTTLAS